MTNTFTKKIYEIMSACIPNCVIKCDEKDPPWITHELKTAIKRKHRVFRNAMLIAAEGQKIGHK